MTEKKYAIDGLFTSQQITGIQRYGRELVLAIDRLDFTKKIQIELIVPFQGCDEDYLKKLKHITVIHYGKRKGIQWEQLDYAHYCRSKNREMICLCNVIPLKGRIAVAAIHDISYKKNPSFFSSPKEKLSAFWHRFQYREITKKSKNIITVSFFSKKEICDTYKIVTNRVSVIYSACDQLPRQLFNDDTFSSMIPYKKGEYYFAMSTIAPNKNFYWILENAKKYPQNKYLLAGKGNNKELKKYANLKNVYYMGYVTEDVMHYLMANCKAFLFPSFYEGFGLPPLEALYYGANVVLSDIPVLHEVYGDAGVYINPFDANINLEDFIFPSFLQKEACIQKYSWMNSAQKLLQLL